MSHATMDLTAPAKLSGPSLPSINGPEDLRHHCASKPALSDASKTLQTHPVSKVSLESRVPLWGHLCGRSRLAVSRYTKS